MVARRLLAALLGLALLAPAQAAAGKPKTVGKAVKVGGSKHVQVRAGGRTKRLKAGAKLKLGATIIMGRGATATLRLVRPKGVPRSRDLVFVRSAKGTRHTSTLTRDGKRIVVRIAPS